ncbi:MAG: hypothetical protein ACRDFQ_06430 [Anaerolineales bacterium]
MADEKAKTEQNPEKDDAEKELRADRDDALGYSREVIPAEEGGEIEGAKIPEEKKAPE